MKRFWTDVTHEQAVQDGISGRIILLDGKPMRLPGGSVLCIPSFPLAQAVVEEWQAAGGEKGGEVGMEATPLTRLAGTAQTRIAPVLDRPWTLSCGMRKVIFCVTGRAILRHWFIVRLARGNPGSTGRH